MSIIGKEEILSKDGDDSDNKHSLCACFSNSEAIIEACLIDGICNDEKHENLMKCINLLQKQIDLVKRLDLFSLNEHAEDLPTESLKFLLIPSYLAYAFTELNVSLEKRAQNLKLAKVYYREFLHTLSAYELVSFKLPWMSEDDDNDDDKANSSEKNANIGNSLENAIARREKKIRRLKQIEELEKFLEHLKRKRANDQDYDESEQREISLTLIKIWAIRAIKELDNIKEEINILNQSHKMVKSEDCTKSDKKEKVRLKTFFIPRKEQQKRVFGLGYPSVPITTVDEWYNEMSKSKNFVNNAPFTINHEQSAKEDSEDDVEDKDEDETDRRRQMERDDWRDTHPRGWGNTYNKG